MNSVKCYKFIACGMLVVSIGLVFAGCSKSTAEIDKASYLAGYQTFTSLEGGDISDVIIERVADNDYDELYNNRRTKDILSDYLSSHPEISLELDKVKLKLSMTSQGKDLKLVNWSLFNLGYLDAKFGKICNP